MSCIVLQEFTIVRERMKATVLASQSYNDVQSHAFLFKDFVGRVEASEQA